MQADSCEEVLNPRRSQQSPDRASEATQAGAVERPSAPRVAELTATSPTQVHIDKPALDPFINNNVKAMQ